MNFQGLHRFSLFHPFHATRAKVNFCVGGTYHHPEEQVKNHSSQLIASSDSPAADDASLLASPSPSTQIPLEDSDNTHTDDVLDIPIRDSFFDSLSRRIFTNPAIFMWFVSSFAAISGFLFGYDIGIIAGALLMMKDAFHLSQGQEEAVVSLVLVGSIVGSLGAGILNDKLGRWRSILISNLAFLVGSAVITFSPTTTLVLVYIGRLIVGLAIGVLPLTSTLYIAELSQPKNRGMMVHDLLLFTSHSLSDNHDS